MNVHYHIGKSIIVDNALRRMSMGSIPKVDNEKKELMKNIHRLPRLGVLLFDSTSGGV